MLKNHFQQLTRAQSLSQCRIQDWVSKMLTQCMKNTIKIWSKHSIRKWVTQTQWQHKTPPMRCVRIFWEARNKISLFDASFTVQYRMESISTSSTHVATATVINIFWYQPPLWHPPWRAWLWIVDNNNATRLVSTRKWQYHPFISRGFSTFPSQCLVWSPVPTLSAP